MKTLAILIIFWCLAFVAVAQSNTDTSRLRKTFNDFKGNLEKKKLNQEKYDTIKNKQPAKQPFLIPAPAIIYKPFNLYLPPLAGQPTAVPPKPAGTSNVSANSGRAQSKAILIGPDQLPGGHRVVSGPSAYDNRVEVNSLDPAQAWSRSILVNARSVAVVVDRSRLIKISAGYYQIDDSRTLGAIYQLCPGEAFRDQPVLGIGTAFVTGSRQMLTAAHVFEGTLQNYAVVFGFELYNRTGAYLQLIAADSVYFPQKVTQTISELDISIFSVDRDLPAPPIPVSQVNSPLNEQVYMIGHPYGLPKKVAANATVVGNTDPVFIYTSLDAFAGNSGSPVFDLQTNELIGVLVGGGVDFIWNGSCNISNVCQIPYCQGEKVVRIMAIRQMIGGGN